MSAGSSYPRAAWYYEWWNTQGMGFTQWEFQDMPYTVKSCTPPSATLYVRNLTTGSGWTTGNITITAGDEVAFQWSSSYTSSCSGTNVSISGTSGTQNTVSEPGAGSSRAYTLSCSGSNYGSASRSITVTSNPASPTCNISLSSNPIYQGGNSVLSWSSSNASSFYIQNVGYVNSPGSTTVSPSQTTSYAGSVSGPGGSANCTGTQVLTVFQYCPFNGQNVQHGSSVTAYQEETVPYGSSCVSQSRTCTDGTLSGSYQYSSCEVSEIPPPPTVSISLSPNVIRRGQTTTATWSSSTADTCTVTGGGDSWTGTSSPPEGQTTSPIIGEVTYTLECENAGGTASASTTVRVLPSFQES